MIQTKKQLQFYIMADMMMNRGYFKPTLMQRLKSFIFPDYIMDYLVTMRKCSFYSYLNVNHGGGNYLYIIYLQHLQV